MSLIKALGSSTAEEVSYRQPSEYDGASVFGLVKKCPPLDQNSRYCNLLQCAHFGNTSMAAFAGDEMVGFVSGYIVPRRPDTLFIWQVAVLEKMRGKRLAASMIKNILASPSCKGVQFLETTITSENRSSWVMFEKLAASLSAASEASPYFTKESHFDGVHDTEMLMRIGPFNYS